MTVCSGAVEAGTSARDCEVMQQVNTITAGTPECLHADRSGHRFDPVRRTTAPFLLPEGFAAPGPVAVLRELRAVSEVGRAGVRRLGARDPVPAGGGAADHGDGEPVLLVPGFLAGDASLQVLSRELRAAGFRTYRSAIYANVSCTARTARFLEARLEAVAERRGTRVRVVGHSLGGMLARAVACRRPDLVSGLVTLGSPVLAPGAHHLALASQVAAMVTLSRLGVPQVMTSDCVAGECARESFEELRLPLPAGTDYTAIYSRRDGVVDWRACLAPDAECAEVPSSHLGMAFDPRTGDVVVRALLTQLVGSRPALPDVG